MRNISRKNASSKKSTNAVRARSAATNIRSNASSAPRGRRGSSKIETLLMCLRKPAGTTIEEMAKVTGWQVHSVRGSLSGAIKKKMGLKIRVERKEDGPTRYSIAEV